MKWRAHFAPDKAGTWKYTVSFSRGKSAALDGGGAAVKPFIGYKLPENDLLCEDFRSRDKSWDYCRIALDFFRDEKIPFAEMQNANALVGNSKETNDKFCLAKPGELYPVYLPSGGTTDLDLSAAKGTFSVKWFNPRIGGKLVNGSVPSIAGGKTTPLGQPPADATEDWLERFHKNCSRTRQSAGTPSPGKCVRVLPNAATTFLEPL